MCTDKLDFDVKSFDFGTDCFDFSMDVFEDIKADYKGVKWTKINKGRPRKYIDKKVFEFLIVSGYTQQAICEYMNVSDTTILTWIRRQYGTKPFKEIRTEIIKKYNKSISKRRKKYE